MSGRFLLGVIIVWKDITMPLFNGGPHFPGDTPFTYKLDTTLDESGANVGQVQMSLHIGTHIDAPFHYDTFGKSIDALPLELFIGEVVVVDVTDKQMIDVECIDEATLQGKVRVFFKTKNTYNMYRFDEQYTIVTAAAINKLAALGVQVIGVDTPSVDAIDNADLTAHHACRIAEMIIIENLYLKDVEAGCYEFIGLPLPFQGADASPIRAVLTKKTAV